MLTHSDIAHTSFNILNFNYYFISPMLSVILNVVMHVSISAIYVCEACEVKIHVTRVVEWCFLSLYLPASIYYSHCVMHVMTPYSSIFDFKLWLLFHCSFSSFDFHVSLHYHPTLLRMMLVTPICIITTNHKFLLLSAMFTIASYSYCTQ